MRVKGVCGNEWIVQGGETENENENENEQNISDSQTNIAQNLPTTPNDAPPPKKIAMKPPHSISSAPLLELDDDNKTTKDICVQQFQQDNNESCYSVAWSSCDAWVFCSIGYDGTAILNHTPSAEKYKILL